MRLLVTFIFLIVSFQAFAEDRTRAILVMDGSGSMWGQIDGVAKITIAQDVVGNLLNELPEIHELGLTVYGHRRKGDCSDIETLVEPGASTRDAIGSAVNAISPKGKTPMTDAVIAAANALRYTEEKATVILVSDGIETCAPDPCAAARALEETGVDFTAHVVGFDVGDDADALAQMQCIADETGGRFLTASNAAELGEALATVAEPDPEYSVEIIATEGEGGPRITAGLRWDVGQSSDGPWLTEGDDSAVQLIDQLPAGTLFARVTRTQDGAMAERLFDIGETTPDVLTLVLPEILRPAAITFEARLEGSGKPIRRDLVWSIADRDGQRIHDHVGAGESTMASPGRYTISAIRTEDNTTISSEFALTKNGKHIILEFPPYAPLATLDAPAEAPAGSNFLVDWTGPNEKNDYVSIARPSQKENAYFNYEYTHNGPTLELVVPPEPGDYEVRYFMAKEGRVVATAPLKATPVTATLSAADEAPSGSIVSVEWTGPGYNNDYIDVSELGSENSKYIHYQYTRRGSRAEVEMPIEPGTYQLRYIMAQGKVVLAAREIRVTEETFDVSGPLEAIAGSTISVDWIGPDLNNDFIALADVGAKGSSYRSYAYTRKGSPASVTLPMEPGTYELRYVVSQGKQSMASHVVTVLPVSGTITASDTVAAGDVIEVTWDGPGYDRDFVAVAEIGTEIGDYLAYQYTRKGKTLEVQAPSQPGEYELRYIALGADQKLLASQPLTVTDVTASLNAPANATPGLEIEVTWDGPGYYKDYVAIFAKGQDKKYVTYQYTRKGDVLTLRAPDEPGSYEIRYIMGQDRRILAAEPLIVQ